MKYFKAFYQKDKHFDDFWIKKISNAVWANVSEMAHMYPSTHMCIYAFMYLYTCFFMRSFILIVTF